MLINVLTYKGGTKPFVSQFYLYFSSYFTQKNYPFLPLNEHPLIPGMPRALPINKELSSALSNLIKRKKNSKIVFSVIKHKKPIDIFSFYKIGTLLNSIPKVRSINEFYEVGCLCDVKLKPNNNQGVANDIIKSSLMINPISLCKISKLVNAPNPIGKVRASLIREKKFYQENLPPELAVKYSVLQDLFAKILRTLSDDNCRAYIFSLKEHFNMKCLNDLIYMGISTLVFPTIFPQYSFLNTNSNKIQELISILDINKRIDATLKILGEVYNQLSTWENLIVQYDISKNQTKTTEKIRSIYLQLKKMFEHTQNEKKTQISQIRNKLKGKKVPEEIMKIINEEIRKYELNDKYSMESNVIRNYLEVLSSLPYGISTEENLDLKKAREVLDESHYGMHDVKERILESIAISKLKGTSQGKILCFVGPPGVGKTSIGESIAKALNRKYYRISLGGDNETSAIKGFRRTYVGAIPGKIVKALKNAQAENPVILLDEIDKLSERNAHGDPYSVLLEVLDPEQNHSFTDDYLDVPINLSKVMFICTANGTDHIPQALFDRMEIIEVSGYTFNEKKFIYDKYLKPKAIERAGLESYDDYSLEEGTVNKIINDYCRESGVRSLQRAVNRIFEKIALKKVQGEENLTVTCENLQSYLGPPNFTSNRMYHDGVLPRGVSIGLGFNNYGGALIYVESNISNFSKTKKTNSITITGNVGKVMNESCQIALTSAKDFLNKKFPEDPKIKEFFDSNSIHIHFTEGAVPKEGPSAGVTICTSLVSLAINKAIVPNLAMTGEITLTGNVMKIGGVKEKVMAAKREGMKVLILPYDNKEDVSLLESNVKEGIKFHFVKKFDDIYNICFKK